MPVDLATIWFWLYPILILPAAIYYGIRVYNHLRHKKSAQTDNLTAQTTAGSLLKIEQRELSNRPPVILSIVLLFCAFLLFAFGVFVIYGWVAGIAEFQMGGVTLCFFVLFICLPAYIFVDHFFIQPKYYKLDRSLVAKEARIIIANDADAVFDACYKALDSMKATINIINKPKLLKAKIRNSVMTIKIRRIKGSTVGVYILSDSKWLTVKFDAGANQRNIDTFLKELSKQ
jgi:hypothetical protein